MNDFKNHLIVILVVGVVTGLLLLFSDFGGYYQYSQYAQTWYYLNIATDFTTGFLIVSTSLLFFFCAWVAYSSIGSGQPVHIGKGRTAAVLALLIVLIGGVVVAIEGETYTDWWYDTGFYAGVIGGILNLIFFSLVDKTVKN